MNLFTKSLNFLHTFLFHFLINFHHFEKFISRCAGKSSPFHEEVYKVLIQAKTAPAMLKDILFIQIDLAEVQVELFPTSFNKECSNVIGQILCRAFNQRIRIACNQVDQVECLLVILDGEWKTIYAEAR